MCPIFISQYAGKVGESNIFSCHLSLYDTFQLESTIDTSELLLIIKELCSNFRLSMYLSYQKVDLNCARLDSHCLTINREILMNKLLDFWLYAIVYSIISLSCTLYLPCRDIDICCSIKN